MSELGQTLLYAFVGLGVFLISLFIMEVITKFSIGKKIVDDGNIAMGIVVGSIVLAMGMIIASAIH